MDHFFLHFLHILCIKVCNLEISEIDFLAYEPHLRNLHEFRWKPLVIAVSIRSFFMNYAYELCIFEEALRQFDSFWYWDSSVVPTIGHFDRVADLIRQELKNSINENNALLCEVVVSE